MRYKIIKPLYLFDGVIQLNGAQADAREGSLEEVPEGYKVIRPICFKVGEVVGFKSIPKGVSDSVTVSKGRPRKIKLR